MLRRALDAWDTHPAAPAGLADRILAATARAGSPAPWAWAIGGERRRRPQGPLVVTWASLAVACSLAFAVGIWLLERGRTNSPMAPGASARTAGTRAHRVGGLSGERLADARALNDALAEATTATLDLARSASEPAARLSLQMIDAATGPDHRSGDTILPGRAGEVIVALPALTLLAPDPSAAGAMLQEVGDRVASGVGPLAKTARHAFGFLLGPAPAKLESPKTLPAGKRA
jgi:hypothetical protein